MVLAGGISWICGKFIHLGDVEYTDNAQVKQHLSPINTRVQGFIKKIYFEEYQSVKKGDTLVVIENTEYLLKVAQAEADYQNALAGKSAMHTTINTTQSNIYVTEAAIEEQRVRLQNAETDYKRYAELMKEEAVTPQQFDRVKTDYAATKARYEQLLRQKESSELVKQEQTQRLEQNESDIKLVEAALNLAKLNLSYTVICATADGVTGRKNIHEGELVQSGQTLVTLVDGTEKWVIANYKETQTTDMKQGQLVEMTVDAIPGVKYQGQIISISDATGPFACRYERVMLRKTAIKDKLWQKNNVLEFYISRNLSPLPCAYFFPCSLQWCFSSTEEFFFLRLYRCQVHWVV